MKKYIFAFLLFCVCFSLHADPASPEYEKTRVDARLNLAVKPDADVVHFVRDNVDPYVMTKIYVLKHADPYELREYLQRIVRTRKVDASNTGIQAIQYNDGAKMLMISAEDYRFDDHENGEGLDKIIEKLDKPGIVSLSGKPPYIYLPKYRSAAELQEMVKNVGAAVADDDTENVGGCDYLRYDAALNLMAFRTAPFSRMNIDNVLKNYDRPYPEIRAKVTVLELYAENDAKMGLDFQAWKNNDGIDLFNGGGRFMQNYVPDGSRLSQGAGWSDTKYLNFNPKWNTKYVDFLVSKGKARVMHCCELSVRNNTTGTINRTSQVFYAKAEPIEESAYTVAYIYLQDASFSTSPEKGKTVVTARTTSGDPITVNASQPATLTVLQLAKDPAVANYYKMTIENGSFSVNGRNEGSSIEAGSVSVVSYAENESGKLVGTTVPFSSDNIPIQKGNRIFLEGSSEFGFRMTMTPSVTEQATILNVQLSNSSLIGYKSDGTPRIQKGAEVASKFMISNSGTTLMIGGVEKRDVVRVSGGLPYLKDMPILGWLFSTESESTKRSQLLVVAEVIPVRLQDTLSPQEQEMRKKVEKDLLKAGESNKWNYHQYGLDPEREKTGEK